MAPPSSIYNDSQSLAEYFYTSTGNRLRWTPNAGIVVASVLVSILGSYTTLTLLSRRSNVLLGRASRVKNVAFLAIAALCFSAVGIWSMHFVSMLGIRLKASPDVTWYLRFSSGYTVLSVLIPVAAVLVAFLVLGGTTTSSEFSLFRLILVGPWVGLVIGLMHYSASFSLPGFNVHYLVATVVVSLLWACIAATTALGLFFRLRAQWQDSELRKAACAVGLAVAVCGMHYIALAGTSYSVRDGTSGVVLGNNKANSTKLTIAISIMCFVLLVISFAMAIYDYMTSQRTKALARTVVLASASFDKTGRLLVRPDGTLPMQSIETDVFLKDIIDELDPRQPTFQWLFSLSFNWSILDPFLSRIAASIADRRSNTAESKAHQKNLAKNAAKGGKSSELHLFRNRWVEASYELANDIGLPLHQLGFLFDRVLPTGTKKQTDKEIEELQAIIDVQNKKKGKGGKGIDEEMSVRGIKIHTPYQGGREGIMLVVVRELKNQDVIDRYLSTGYRLAEIRFFSHVLSQRLGIQKDDLEAYLGACKTFAKRGTRPVVQPGGVYVGLFGIRQMSGKQGVVDVLVYDFARHQIPAYRLPDVQFPLRLDMKNFITSVRGQTMQTVLDRCEDEMNKPAPRQSKTYNRGGGTDADDEDEEKYLEDPLVDFVIALSISIEALGQAMIKWPDIYETARLSPEILDVPSSEDDSTPPAQMIVFEVVLPAAEPHEGPLPVDEKGQPYDPQAPPKPFIFTPHSLFTKTQTMLLKGKAADEFSAVVCAQLEKDYQTGPAQPKPIGAPTGAIIPPAQAGVEERLMSEHREAPSGALPPPPSTHAL